MNECSSNGKRYTNTHRNAPGRYMNITWKILRAKNQYSRVRDLLDYQHRCIRNIHADTFRIPLLRVYITRPMIVIMARDECT